MTKPVKPTAPPVADRSERSTFSDRVAAQLTYLSGALPDYVSDSNDFIELESTSAQTAKTDAETAQGLAETARTGAQTAQGLAEDAKDAALSASNFTGPWSAQSYAHPACVSYDGKLWLLDDTSGAVAGDVPGVSAKWLQDGIEEAPSDGSQYARQDGAWAEIFVPAPGGTVQAVASGALGNGDVVSLNNDGTVSVAGIVMEENSGTPVVFESASTDNISCCYDSANGKIVIAYTDVSNSRYGTAIVGTVSGTAISFGTAVVFEGARAEVISCCYDSSNGKVVIAYMDMGNSNYGTAVVGTVSGTSISFGTPVVFESTTTNNISCCYDSANGKIVIAYADGGNINYGTAIVGTVSGTSISFGTAVVFETATTQYISTCYDSFNEKVVIAYQDANNSGYGIAVVGTVSSTAISFGTPVVFESANTYYTSCCYDSANGKAVISYTDVGNSSHGTAIVGTVSGTSISFGTAVVFESASTAFISCCYDSVTNKVFIAYQDVTNSGYGTAVVGTVSSTAISFGTPVVFESADINYTTCCYDSANSKVVAAYQDRGNANYGTAVVYNVGYSTASEFLGISSAAYDDLATAEIHIVGGIADNQTGLTTGATYYVGADGSLTTVETDFGAIGRALSATELLVTHTGTGSTS